MVEGNRQARRKRAYIGAGLALAVVVTTGAVVLASVPHTFSTGETLTAANLNSNFSAIDQRIAALESLLPSGTVVAYGGPSSSSADAGAASIPSGWLLCDGSAVSRTTYASLFAASRNQLRGRRRNCHLQSSRSARPNHHRYGSRRRPDGPNAGSDPGRGDAHAGGGRDACAYPWRHRSRPRAWRRSPREATRRPKSRSAVRRAAASTAEPNKPPSWRDPWSPRRPRRESPCNPPVEGPRTT